ncbi:hypothetical protein NHX12_031070 [Muraenolepis orangiensis]|uniref:C2H2-type domain-containing protein n=1 Tax=Muraenolepis orangiensis TaxID=630683 RepID=A0A9Q0IMF6_9TELE|nr:hypothetical protein NHX12_031070 [Muraenolepis orangiensis]
MSKTPPNRRGINFEVGAQLEARDSLKNWYAANIEKMDYDEEKVLIHYRQWSHRYDEWFDWTSPYLRPVERIKLRRRGVMEDVSLPGFNVNEKVLASWSDCRFYPAKVLAINKDASYTVKFYDGVIQNVKEIHVKPFVKEGKTKAKDERGEVGKVRGSAIKREPQGAPRPHSLHNRPAEAAKAVLSNGEEPKPYDTEEEPKPYSETANGAPARPDPPSVSLATAETNGDTAHTLSSQTEDSEPPAEAAPPQPAKPVRKQESHPSSVLSVNLDHNPFKCVSPGCTKSFRKAKLLHYHMKYYHGEDQPQEEDLSPTRGIQTRATDKPPTPESPKRRRTISASMHESYPVGATPPPQVKAVAPGSRRTSAPPAVNSQGSQRALLREKCKENQLERNGCQQHKNVDKTTSGFDIATVKERIKDKPKQKDFLHEDSLSDWSTDSCGWSDDDMGADLDVTSPPLSGDSVAMDTSDQEIVRCVCEVEEENDFMIQCEECLCWQHGTCMGLLEENVPDKYVCYICRDPPGQRQSLRYWYDRDWLSTGHMYGLSSLAENYSHQNAKKITATHQLLGDVHHILQVLSGLQLKMAVLQSKTQSDLHLWRQPWKQGPRKTYDSYPGTPDEDMSRGEMLMSNALEKLSRDSYIVSEHCYQKPRAYYPAVEQRLVVETRQGSELEDSMRSTEDLLEREHRYGGLLLDMGRTKALPGLTKGSNLSKRSQAEMKVKKEEEKKVKEEELGSAGGPPDDEDNGRQQQQWTLNLLDHIDSVQDDVAHRMDFVEKELDVLESWLDYTGELEPPDPLARLPQLKQRMKKLLAELGQVQQMALWSST